MPDNDGKCHFYQPNSMIPLCGCDLDAPEGARFMTWGDAYEEGLSFHRQGHCTCGNEPCEKCDEAAEAILAKQKLTAGRV